MLWTISLQSEKEAVNKAKRTVNNDQSVFSFAKSFLGIDIQQKMQYNIIRE